MDTAGVREPIDAYFRALNGEDLGSETVVGKGAIADLYRQRAQVYGYGRQVHFDAVEQRLDLAAARCHSTGTLLLRKEGRTLEVVARELFLLRRDDRGWRITCYMNNRPGA
jgi:threonine dehydrogenase-like Zn-dependent dehydrogenase